ncbi:ABC transporter ATP-binding protein [Stutzerimonas nitrititolerans]|uniref:ABC transporter ATP-binding protein n=1 Tax=Stutzerimonas nitrititolerans TaxID=2482751 RepID=UPI0028A95D04|nr:ABC transporter ATP-binding protein [Stutzerimonas nitrititolerans]
MNCLEARALAIGYAGQPLGQNLDLRLNSGEVLCLLGPNGSGKSTLFKTLLGLLRPLAGSVLLDGQPLSEWSRRRLAQCLGYVPQAQSLSFPFSVEDMVLLGRSAHLKAFAQPSAHDRQVARDCLRRLNILDLAPRIYTHLSGGERQLVLIARALAQEPALLILDEPTASLDFGNQVRVLEQLRALRDQGLGILLCTHQPEHALRVADRIALYKQGRIVHCGSRTDTLTLQRLAWLYDLPAEQIARQMQLLTTLTSGSHHEPR